MSLNFLKTSFAVTQHYFSRKLLQVTGATYENEHLANSICSRDSQQWTFSKMCLAGGNMSDKMFFQVGWNTGRENLSCHHRHLVQDALTHWQPVELAKQRLGITVTTCCQNQTSCIVLHSLQLTDG